MPMAKERGRAMSPSPTYMSEDQMSSYLQNLRSNRPTRPVGSRPPPSTWATRPTYSLNRPVSESPPLAQSTFKEAAADADKTPTPQPTPDAKKHQRTTSERTIDGVVLAGSPGRALVQPPRGRDRSTSTTRRERTPSIQYRENAQRQIEREEAHKVRVAMEELDLDPEERLYRAARDEAAELVWRHQHPNAPENNPLGAYAYPGLAKKEMPPRSRSVGRGEQEQQDLQRSQSKLRKRNSLGSSAGGSGSRSSSLQSQRTPSGSPLIGSAGFSPSPQKESFSESESPVKKGFAQRRRSSGSKRHTSGSVFKDPNDKIYEEPEEEQAATPTSVIAPAPAPAPAPAASAPEVQTPHKAPLAMRRNPFSRVQFAKNNILGRSITDSNAEAKPKLDRYEIYRNPPTQSRTAGYTSNESLPLKPKPAEGRLSDVENETEVKMKDGKEIRSEELRAATGFKLKDRSPKLPTPTVVSDKPGRPIVSFRKDWFKPKEIELKGEVSLLPSTYEPVSKTEQPPRPLSSAHTAPIIPTINAPDDTPKNTRSVSPRPLPSISVNGDGRAPSPSPAVNGTFIPTINTPEDHPRRPLPTPNSSRKVNTSSHSAPTTIPTINVSQTPAPARSHPARTSPIPTICVQETPKSVAGSHARGARVNMPSIPTIAVNEPAEAPRGRVSPPSISVTPSVPAISVSEPSAPKTRVTPPSISVTPSVPSISVNGSSGSTRPLPDPANYSPKAFPRHSTRGSQSHWTPTAVRTGALCSQCALPISGRIVSAAGSRFHPECFVCHHCGEHLECVAFYPEPDVKHAERVARIRARQRGQDIEFLPTHPTPDDMLRLEADDGFDESKRFFCHLDFHELFSPRCKSCKTPIEGEVIVACGAEWHVGHFFCAQCGDPFDSTTPFVEKDGYAWCVGCHTNRYSAKCRKCRKPVVDTVVKALGAEWHMQCFCCMECGGEFDDGRYFLRGESQDPVCVRCEERRLKA